MINYKLFKDNNLRFNKITKDKSCFIIETKSDKYVVKPNELFLDKTYKYLNSRGFNYFPNYFILDKYMIYNYIDNNNENDEERLIDLVILLSLLHLKTTRYSKIDIDDLKIIYENLDNQINNLYEYYSKINDEIDTSIYMSPSSYLLIRNISIIYSALDFSKSTLNNWYENIKNSDRERKVLIHNNFDLNHIRKNKSTPYLISFSKSKIDFPIYELYNIYINTYDMYDFKDILKVYESKYPLTNNELSLLFILISIPDKIDFTNDEYLDTIKVKNMINRLIKSDQFIKPYIKKEVLDKK